MTMKHADKLDFVDMFNAMLESISITSTAGITDEMMTSLVDETDTFAKEQGYHGAPDVDGYIANDFVGVWA